MLSFLLLTALGVKAQDCLLVYNKAAQTDTFALSTVKKISHSRLNAAGERQADYVQMNIALTSNDTRSYLLADVDSVVLVQQGRRTVLTEFCGRMSADPSTQKAPRRTSLDGDFETAGEAVNFYWEDGDHIYLADGRRDTLMKMDRFVSPTDSIHAEQASFFFGGKDITADEVTVYYPGQAPLAYNQLRISAKQEQQEVSNSMHIGVAGDCGTAVAKRGDDGKYTFTLEHRAAYLCFLPCIGNDLKRTVLKQITVRSDSAIAGIFTLSDKGLKPTADTTHTITLTTGRFVLPERSSASTTAFMVLAPQNGALRLTCEFTVEDTLLHSTGTYTKTLDLQKVEPNMLYLVKANLNNYVCDLGLPFKVMNHNMGATYPEDFGSYYAWGMLDEGSYDSGNYPLKNQTLGGDIKNTEYDVAHMRLGKDYSMPNMDEMCMLADSCTSVWTTINGVNGRKLTGKNGNTVFLPAAGYDGRNDINSALRYRTSSLPRLYDKNFSDGLCAYIAYSTSSYTFVHTNILSNFYSYRGCSVRPVISRAGQMQDGTLLRLTTTRPEWALGNASATLHADVRGLSKAKTPVKVGFVVGSTENVTKADGTTLAVSTPTADGDFSATFSNVEENNVYYCRAYIEYDKDSIFYANARQFGRKFIDLGLPSGTLWCNINIGGSMPEDEGTYFSWGETETRDIFYSDVNRWYDQNTWLQPDRLFDIQATRYDVAAKQWGGVNMLPSYADMQELAANCTMQTASLNGMMGIRFTSKKNGNSIFFAKAGYRESYYGKDTYYQYSTNEYNLSSTVNTDRTDQCDGLSNGNLANNLGRADGKPVRAVQKLNATADDGSPLFIRTLPAGKQYDGTTETDTLRAVVRGNVGNTPVGIVWWQEGNDRADGTQVVLTPDADGHMQTILCNLVPGTTYCYQVYAGTGDAATYGDTLSVDAVGLVDLGLSVQWANVNIGAASIGDGGTHFQWGSTVPYRNIDQYYTGSDNLSAENGNDAAAANWGLVYRMPTKEEMQELLDSCTWTKQKRNGMPGYLVTSKRKGYTDRSIFLPNAGYYSNSYLYGMYRDNDVYYLTSTTNGQYCYRLYYRGGLSNPLRVWQAFNFGNRKEGYHVRAVVDTKGATVLTSGCDWTIGAETATLKGTVASYNPLDASAEYGFVVGNTPDIDITKLAAADVQQTTITAQPATTGTQPLTFSAAYTYDGSSKYFRAYVKVGGNYYQGGVMSISAAKLLDVAFRADNSAFDASSTKLVARTVGTPAVAYNSEYKRNETTLTNSYANTASQFYAFDFRGRDEMCADMVDGHSLEVLMKMDAAPANDNDASILCNLENGGSCIRIYKKVIESMFYIDGSYKYCTSTVTPEAGKYYHIIATYNKEEGKIILYINGEQAVSTDVSGTLGLPSYDSRYFVVGGNPSGTHAYNSWPGSVSVARVYDKALSAEEVQTLYNNLKK